MAKYRKPTECPNCGITLSLVAEKDIAYVINRHTREIGFSLEFCSKHCAMVFQKDLVKMDEFIMKICEE